MAIGSSRFDAGTWAQEPRFACWPEAGEQDRPQVPPLVTCAAEAHAASRACGRLVCALAEAAGLSLTRERAGRACGTCRVRPSEVVVPNCSKIRSAGFPRAVAPQTRAPGVFPKAAPSGHPGVCRRHMGGLAFCVRLYDPCSTLPPPTPLPARGRAGSLESKERRTDEAGRAGQLGRGRPHGARGLGFTLRAEGWRPQVSGRVRHDLVEARSRQRERRAEAGGPGRRLLRWMETDRWTSPGCVWAAPQDGEWSESRGGGAEGEAPRQQGASGASARCRPGAPEG